MDNEPSLAGQARCARSYPISCRTGTALCCNFVVMVFEQLARGVVNAMVHRIVYPLRSLSSWADKA
jgi:hypothetical protein